MTFDVPDAGGIRRLGRILARIVSPLSPGAKPRRCASPGLEKRPPLRGWSQVCCGGSCRWRSWSVEKAPKARRCPSPDHRSGCRCGENLVTLAQQARLAYSIHSLCSHSRSIIQTGDGRKTKQAPFQVPVFSEATVGIEPTYKGFADPRLTTWPRRRNELKYTIAVRVSGESVHPPFGANYDRASSRHRHPGLTHLRCFARGWGSERPSGAGHGSATADRAVGAHVPSKKRRRRDAAPARTIGPGDGTRRLVQSALTHLRCFARGWGSERPSGAGHGSATADRAVGAHVPSKKRRRRDAAPARTIGPGDGTRRLVQSAPNGGCTLTLYFSSPLLPSRPCSSPSSSR